MTDRSVGYVGLDHHHAEPYLQTLETLPATVTSACEPNADFDVSTVDSLGNVPVYDDLERMLSSESLDAVFLTLPNRDTPAAIEQALDAGVDVFTEKPAARTADELEPLLKRVAVADETVCVSYPWQSHPVSREIEKLVDDGFFGNLEAFETRYVASQLAFRDTDHFIFDEDASRGGILQWLGIHWLQLLTRLLEEPITRVNASTVAGTDGVDVEDVATLQLETADGALGTLHCGYHLGEGVYDTRIDLYGSDGRSSWDPMGREFGFDGETMLDLDDVSGEWASTPHRTITHEYEPAPGYGGSWGREFVESFFDACESGGESPVTLEDAMEVLRILDAAYESAETGKWVDVASDGN
ncbi:Gfo/Idh/MocA family oxidoreductase [Natronoglomus mannanivorans]|uniref:Gfo/Idh/MocA family oxidoreductase n=1 Tax=Natronoglomus mannanivorans TaxID=2979990 RepID=A0AAP2Z2A6_9EURY|nr:Gfo/Idh/MocA family oxidoreductase [Halobacteria archaeon AArc-xg1-1]